MSAPTAGKYLGTLVRNAQRVVPLALLSGGTIVAFAFGIVLQAVAVRRLDAGDYATFVLGLAVGNIANALAASVQPVVALHVAHGDLRVWPLKPSQLLAISTALALAVALVLAPVTGGLLAAMVGLQLPLHAVVGVGQGRLQGERRFRSLGLILPAFALGRLGVVGIGIALGDAQIEVFVLGLLIGLALTICLLTVLGAYKGLALADSEIRSSLIVPFLMWGAFAWLLNADAVLARLSLTDELAGRYATAFTLGRLPVFTVAPLVTLILPLATNSTPEAFARLFRQILLVSAAALLTTLLVLSVDPGVVVELFEGHSDPSVHNLVRIHAVIGAVAASVTLLLTLNYGRGGSWRPLPFVIGTLALFLAGRWSEAPVQIALLQLGILVALWVHITSQVLRRRRA